MEIRILGGGCARCKTLEQNVFQAAAKLNIPADIQAITDIIEISKYGVMSTPALVINGKVKTVGKVPNVAQVIELIREEMQQ